MTPDWQALALSAGMGVGLAAAAGFRVFVPLLLGGLALRFEFGPLAGMVEPSARWLASDAALACFAVATVVEVLAYKIPWLDNVLDAAGAPVALAAGALLASEFLAPGTSPLFRYGLGVIAGAGSAGIVHGTMAAARLVSTKTTAGLANPVLAAGELGASAATSLVAILLPFLVLIAAMPLLLFAVFLWRGKRRAARSKARGPRPERHLGAGLGGIDSHQG